jgi:hypothetical protein
VTSTKPTAAAPTGVTTTLPQSSGATATSAAITVKAGQSYDGGMKKFDRSRMLPPAYSLGEVDTNTEQPRFARARARRARPMLCSSSKTAPLCLTYVLPQLSLKQTPTNTNPRLSSVQTRPRVSTARAPAPWSTSGGRMSARTPCKPT